MVVAKKTGFLLRYAKFFFTALALSWFSIFVLLNKVLPGQVSFRRLLTPVDSAIPLVPEWELIYFLTVVLPLVPILYIRNRRWFIHVVWYFVMMLSAAYLFFLFFPVEIDRPVPGGNSFFDWGVRLNHKLDNPINCFPSFHVATAAAVAFMIMPINRTHGLILWAVAILIALSVLFVKAHYLADVPAGFFLAWVFHRLYLRRYHHTAGTDYHRWSIPVFFALFFGLLAGLFLLYRLEVVVI